MYDVVWATVHLSDSVNVKLDVWFTAGIMHKTYVTLTDLGASHRFLLMLPD